MRSQPEITKVYRPLKAMRLFCIYCMGSQPKLVEGCDSKRSCYLWPYRMGRRPIVDSSASESNVAIDSKKREANLKRGNALKMWRTQNKQEKCKNA